MDGGHSLRDDFGMNGVYSSYGDDGDDLRAVDDGASADEEGVGSDGLDSASDADGSDVVSDVCATFGNLWTGVLARGFLDTRHQEALEGPIR